MKTTTPLMKSCQSAAEQKAKRLLAEAVDSLDSEHGVALVMSEIRHPLPLWASKLDEGSKAK